MRRVLRLAESGYSPVFVVEWEVGKRYVGSGRVAGEEGGCYQGGFAQV